MEECDTVEVARRFGTPIYVVSENQLRRNVRRFIEAFRGRWPQGHVNVLPPSRPTSRWPSGGS